MKDYKSLGGQVKDGFTKEYDCGCVLVDGSVSPYVVPCCYEHEGLLLAQQTTVILTFGKHRGKKLEDVPFEYLQWLEGQDLDEPLKSRLPKYLAEYMP